MLTPFERDMLNLFNFRFETPKGGCSFTNTSFFPPYEITKMKGDKYLIEIAVAGYKKENLDIKVEKGTLTIKGKPSCDNPDIEKTLESTMKKGRFTRSFALDDNVEVCSSKLEDGLLKIYLNKIIPEEDLPRKIDID